MKTALDNLLNRMPLQDLRIVVTAILIQKESGGNLAEVLDKTSYLIRERFRLKRQIKTHTAQGRLTGWVLTCVPVALGIAMYIANPQDDEHPVAPRHRHQADVGGRRHDFDWRLHH